MSNKLKYYQRKIAEPIEFPQEVVRILLPNGDEYNLRFDPRLNGLVINKAYSDNESSMTIAPHVSNEVLIK